MKGPDCKVPYFSMYLNTVNHSWQWFIFSAVTCSPTRTCPLQSTLLPHVRWASHKTDTLQSSQQSLAFVFRRAGSWVAWPLKEWLTCRSHMGARAVSGTRARALCKKSQLRQWQLRKNIPHCCTEAISRRCFFFLGDGSQRHNWFKYKTFFFKSVIIWKYFEYQFILFPFVPLLLYVVDTDDERPKLGNSYSHISFIHHSDIILFMTLLHNHKICFPILCQFRPK